MLRVIRPLLCYRNTQHNPRRDSSTMDEDAIPSSTITTTNGGPTTVIDTVAVDGTSTIMDAAVATSTGTAEHAQCSNMDSNLHSDTSTASIAMLTPSDCLPAQNPMQILEQQLSGDILLPSGEEMDCKNTLHSFDGRENHSINEISPDGLPEISVLSLPSDLQTLAQTVIGTPVTTVSTANTPPVGLDNDTYTGTRTTTGTGSTTNGIPIHADAVVAVTSIPEADAFVINSANENKSPSSSPSKLNRVAIGAGIILVLIIGMIIGITIPIVEDSSSSSKLQDDEIGRSTPQIYIAAYISQFINNITLSNRYLRSIDDRMSTTNFTAEEASLRWLIEDSLNDLDWIEFYERNGKDNAEREPYDPVADLRQHLTLTQKYVLLILWFQQKDLVTMEFAESWTRTDGWLRDANVCMWYGITCEDIDLMTLLNDEDGTGRIDNNTTIMGTDIDALFSVVTGIDFTGDDGYYSVDSEMKDQILYDLVLLLYVVMDDGILFTGTIPHDIGLLTHLSVINFKGNYVDGTIPSSLSLLSNLEVFVVAENMISGPIPESMQHLKALIHLDISNNKINGTIPSSLSQLANLDRFHATSNVLSGTLPELHWHNISFFDVSYNRLKGTLPMVMQEWTSVTIFLVMSNRFSGTIPTWIDKLTNMTAFSIAGNIFTGTIPSSIRSWDYPSYIDLSSNELRGTVPLLLSSSQLVYLGYVNITNNKLNGTIPFSKGFCDQLLYFSCVRNLFDGSIPDGYESCVSLYNFEISHNQLTGTLPSWIFQSTALQTFRAADNEFTGTLPDGINEAIIMDFQVQNNRLAGTIPAYVEQWIFLEVFDVSGNILTGTIPSQLGAPTILLQDNSFSGNVSETICTFATRIEADCDLYCICCTNC